MDPDLPGKEKTYSLFLQNTLRGRQTISVPDRNSSYVPTLQSTEQRNIYCIFFMLDLVGFHEWMQMKMTSTIAGSINATADEVMLQH